MYWHCWCLQNQINNEKCGVKNWNLHERGLSAELLTLFVYVSLSCDNLTPEVSRHMNTVYLSTLPGGLHYKRPHYLPVTQSYLRALLISKTELLWPFMLMSPPPSRTVGQRDTHKKNKTKQKPEAGVLAMSLKEEEIRTQFVLQVLQMHFVTICLYGWKQKYCS